MLGHSEGDLIAALAAERTGAAGLVSVSGAGFSARQLLAASGLSDALRAEAAQVLASLESGQPVGQVEPELHALFRPSVQPYLIDWLRHDPAEILDRLDLPLLLVQGDRDIQISLTDVERLHAARPDAELVRLPDMNHVLRDVGPDRDGNVASYNDPARPLSSGLAEAIARFVVGL